MFPKCPTLDRSRSGRRLIVALAGALTIASAALWPGASVAAAGPPLADLPGAAATAPPAGVKTATAGARLLLPYFEVDTVRPLGTTTLFAVRNETAAPAAITLRYHKTDQPQAAQVVQTATLAAKGVKTVNIRDVPGLFADDDGLRRGFLIIETDSGEPEIEGDYFQITPEEAFANGDRLLNLDPASPHNELCRTFSLRFLNGGAFTGGTLLTVWLGLSSPPSTNEPVLFYRIYNDQGELRLQEGLFADEVAFQVSAAALVNPNPTDFGAVEIELNGTVGHVSAVFDANGLYSVGLPGACRDF